MRVLQGLERSHGIHLEVINGGQVAHSESLAMKRRSHIVIDQCVTGSYHRNSLEGLALANAVVNGVGLLPGVVDAFRCCSGETEIPFVFATLDDIESQLRLLIEEGHEALAATGDRNRRWIEAHWDFGKQWKHFWEPVVVRALERVEREHWPVSVPVMRNEGWQESESAQKANGAAVAPSVQPTYTSYPLAYPSRFHSFWIGKRRYQYGARKYQDRIECSGLPWRQGAIADFSSLVG